MSNKTKTNRPYNKSDATECVHCGVEFYRGDYKDQPKDAITSYNHDCEGMKVDHVDVDDHYFACRCSGESRAECDWIMAEACRLMSTKHNSVTKENLATAVTYNLEWGYQAHISGIRCDQWCGVSSECYTPKGYEAEDFSTYIQCDEVEDGLAATYVAWVQKFGDERKLVKQD